MTDQVVCISEEILSVAWARAFLAVMKPGVSEIAPMVIKVTGFDNGIVREMPEIRHSLEQALSDCEAGLTCDTVSRTIFPHSLWNPDRPRVELYERYRRILPRIRRCPPNKNGIYFERMIAYGAQAKNQLEHVIGTYRQGNHRRSALQVAILDPSQDQTNQRMRPFPCLQQVAFSPLGDGGLCVTGLYPTQYLFERAYGNYLGLCRLGRFMACEMGLEMRQMQCFIGVAQRGRPNKGDLGQLAKRLEEIIGTDDE